MVQDTKLQEVLQNYSIFAKKELGNKIHKSDVADLLRSLYISPTNAQLDRLIDDSQEYLAYDEFLVVYNQAISLPNRSELELVNLLRMYDTNNDAQITLTDLQYILTKMGEHLTEEEFERLIKLANIKLENGKLSYAKFIKLIMF